MSINAILGRSTNLYSAIERRVSTRLGADAATRAVDAVRAARTKHESAAPQPAPDAATEHMRNLRAELGAIDFRHITPRQMAELGSKLFAGGELSDVAATSFIGIEKNLVDELEPDLPMDVVAHFDRMLNAVAEANAREPGYFDWGVQYRQIASKALDDLMSYAKSPRLHVIA